MAEADAVGAELVLKELVELDETDDEPVAEELDADELAEEPVVEELVAEPLVDEDDDVEVAEVMSFAPRTALLAIAAPTELLR